MDFRHCALWLLTAFFAVAALAEAQTGAPGWRDCDLQVAVALLPPGAGASCGVIVLRSRQMM
jgi:hypothetical protein